MANDHYVQSEKAFKKK